MKKKYSYTCYLIVFLLLTIAIGYKFLPEQRETQQSVADTTLVYLTAETVPTAEELKRQIYYQKSREWVDKHIDKDFLLGKIRRQNNPLLVRVDARHTERNIYLLYPVYESYKRMFEAALLDGVHLKIISGHRVFYEQIYEWELRWNNPRTNTVFANDAERARHVLRYRAMPGTSRHHWGTDIDLNNFNPSYFETAEGKKMYQWLLENASSFGFYQPYTALDENRPFGYQEEKWHWSYKPLAQPMLEKYLKLVSIDDISGFRGDAAAKLLPIIEEWVRGINPEMFED
jgi:LAS superfamily LD-carboxypeptidase LdcB